MAKKRTCGVERFDVISGCVEETNKPLLCIGVGATADGAALLAMAARGTKLRSALAS